ncbi:acyl-CoA-binding domain-containing protein 4 isoform X1 [Brachionichthys hirsutus]|uniref:acyl-CoA-binding domain-containing protein 4 isoform X1 n=1 Tax=Brachionichthys hirsutus TaxID=412623 RepID=UPI003604E7B6
MPVPAMADHHKQFQAAVDVIHNLPKTGCYQPSYKVMLHFYSLYKQALWGPCSAPRPGFWDPVGRYKWDAWRRLGEMSRDQAMERYVDEMKSVAQEVLDTMPVNEQTASLLHHFKPLYRVVEGMPRPPEPLLRLQDGLGCSDGVDRQAEMKDEDEDEDEDEERGGPQEDLSLLGGPDPDQDLNLSVDTVHHDSGVSEGFPLASDSESEVFCDSVDSMEQLGSAKIPLVKSNGFHNGHVFLESSPFQNEQRDSRPGARRVGAGQGGEVAEEGKGQGPSRRSQNRGRGGSSHNWRERGVPQGSPRRGAPGGGSHGRGGGDGSEGGVDRLHDVQLQQQIIVALRRLREDMRSVMDRLEVVERLAATHGSPWQPCLHCAATASQQGGRRRPVDVSGQTIVVFLLWPFVAQGLVYLLRKAQKRSRISS